MIRLPKGTNELPKIVGMPFMFYCIFRCILTVGHEIVQRYLLLVRLRGLIEVLEGQSSDEIGGSPICGTRHGPLGIVIPPTESHTSYRLSYVQGTYLLSRVAL